MHHLPNQTVEAIARWKQSREASKPEGHDDFPAHPHCTFVYRQENYLLKIVSDVDFLENSPTIQRLYPSTQLYGNPFLSPAALADRPTSGGQLQGPPPCTPPCDSDHSKLMSFSSTCFYYGRYLVKRTRLYTTQSEH